MLSVLFLWADIALTCYIPGFFILRVIGGYRPRARAAYLLAGLVFAAVFAEVWSLFGGVGSAALLSLHVLCAALLILLWKRRLSAGPGSLRAALSGRTINGALLLILFALMTSAGVWHTDTPLYHAQFIHWTETLGAVPGLGNLMSFFGFNNACFPLYALYSFAWLTGQSFHAVQGFLAFLAATLCLLPDADSAADPSPARRLPRLAIRAASLFGIFLLAEELVSPSSDCFLLLLCYAAVLLWSSLLARREASPVPFAFLCMLVVFAVTVKLAAAPLLLLCIKPVALLLRGKRRNLRAFLAFVLCAAAISLPFFVRGFILSGWLLYPVLPQHLIDVPWRVPDGVGVFAREEIAANGRMIFDAEEIVASLDAPPFAFVDGWFIRQPRAVRALLFLTLGALLLTALRTALFCARFLRLRKPTGKRPGAGTFSPDRDALFLELTLAACVFFWFFTTPQVRFGEVWLLLLCAASYGALLGDLLTLLPARAWARLAALDRGVLAAFALALLVLAAREGAISLSHPVLQQDYERYPVADYRIGGFTLYYPTEFVYTGYYAFPATRWQVTDAVPLGDELRDGFGVKP